MSMWTCVDSVWDAADSKSDLQVRMTRLESGTLLPLIETDEATVCGLLTIPGESPLLVPVCYSHVGIPPSVAVSDGLLAIGMGNDVVVMCKRAGGQVFRYRMPTTFHQFLPWNGDDLLCMDEVGFILLSAKGEETWSFLLDVIARFEMEGNTIKGETLEGESFQTQLPRPNT